MIISLGYKSTHTHNGRILRCFTHEFLYKSFFKGCHKRDKPDEYQQLAAIKGVTNLYNSLTIRALGRIVTPFAKKVLAKGS